jgi:L-alanine-DL-glutamate epimerase-like enolase superfamily enzyme
MGPEQLESTLYQMDIPLLGAFSTATGRVSVRTVGLVSVSRGGTTGWGEAAPYPGQDEPFSDVIEAVRTGGMTPTLAAAIDEAVCDLVARERGESIAAEVGTPVDIVPVSIAVGVGEDALAVVDKAVAAGVGRVKVKVMPGRTDHVRDIRRQYGHLSIGIDGNGSFDSSTIAQILELQDESLAYVEQPCASLDDQATARLADAGFDVFADESVRSAGGAAEVLSIPAVAGVVVKPGRLGWQASVVVVQMAREVGKRWRASGLLETGIGRAFTESLAAASDAYLSDVAPVEWFLSFDVVPPRGGDGYVTVAQGPGSGIDVDRDEVRRRASAVFPVNGSVAPGLD